MNQVIKVMHTQEDGQDIVTIYAPAGYEYLIGQWEVEVDPFKSAVDSIWSGYMKAIDLFDIFGRVNISVHSTVAGAIDAFDAELNEGDEEECDL